MANVLTQSEIDNLLNALTSGESVDVGTAEETDEKQKVREYDFRTANKFYKEQMRTLNVIFDNFAYILANRLTGILHTLCEIEVVSIEEQKFGEFNNSIPIPAILAVIEMEPLQGSILMELSSSVAYAFISRLFGGAADYAGEDKPFTEIELAVNESILHEIMRVLKDSFGKIAQVKPVLSRMETSAQFTQITDMNEPSAIVMLNVKIDKIQGSMSLCIPHYSIQPITKELNTMSWTMASNRPAVQDDDKKDIVEKQLDDTPVELNAVFNQTTATLREILSLRVGDTICIDHNINDFITVNVEGVPKFKGVAGVYNNKYVVQVAKIIKENKGIE